MSGTGDGGREMVNDAMTYRPLTIADIGSVPSGCQGDPEQVRARVRDLGSSAILAFDGDRHVGQLQFRRYAANTRSPNGLWDPLYWGNFGSAAPSLPIETLNVYCFHVGQLDDTDARDATYQARGIGLQLLDYFLDWATGRGFNAVVAKATPSVRSVMGFMGGLPPKPTPSVALRLWRVGWTCSCVTLCGSGS